MKNFGLVNACTFSMEHILYSIFYLMHYKILMNIIKYGSDLRGFRLKGFGLARLYCTIIHYFSYVIFIISVIADFVACVFKPISNFSNYPKIDCYVSELECLCYCNGMLGSEAVCLTTVLAGGMNVGLVWDLGK